MAGGERGGLVEEEQLGEPAGPHQRRPVPAAEPQPARDPPLPCVGAADAPGFVVQTAAVAVHEPARGIGDELAERRHPVPARHRVTLRLYTVVPDSPEEGAMGYGWAIDERERSIG